MKYTLRYAVILVLCSFISIGVGPTHISAKAANSTLNIKEITNVLVSAVNDDIWYNGKYSVFRSLEGKKYSFEIYRDRNKNIYFLCKTKIKVGVNYKYCAIGLEYYDNTLINTIDSFFANSIKDAKNELSEMREKYYITIDVSFPKVKKPAYGKMSSDKKVVIGKILKLLPTELKNSSVKIPKGEYQVYIRDYRENDFCTYAVLSQNDKPKYILEFELEPPTRVLPFRQYKVTDTPFTYLANQYIKSSMYSTTINYKA